MRGMGIGGFLFKSGVFVLAAVCLCSCKSGGGATRAPVVLGPAASQPTTKPLAKLPAWPADKPVAPAVLPGAGLGQYDFFYAGEAKTEDMYIVRKGAIVWSHHDAATKGEISDAQLLSNGNILFAHQHGVSLIDPGDKILWHFEAPAKSEIHTAQMIGQDHVLFIINGPEPKLVVMNVNTNAIERQFPLPVKNLKNTHGQFRHARLTDTGTVLVAHMDLGKVVEYDENGKPVWSIAAPGVWSAQRLANGNTLITCNRLVYEVDPGGNIVWHFSPADIPDYKVTQFQVATRLANGDTLVNNWVNQWNVTTQAMALPQPAQAWEVTPDKQIVWVLRSWDGLADLGPATTIQILDGKEAAVEDVHFGDIR